MLSEMKPLGVKMRHILLSLFLTVSTQASSDPAVSINIQEFETLDQITQDAYLLGLMDGILFTQIAARNLKNSDDVFAHQKP